MKTWKFKVSMSVADSWIIDGFNLKERIEEIEEKLQAMLPYAYEHEVIIKVQIVSEPGEKQILALQNGEIEPKD